MKAERVLVVIEPDRETQPALDKVVLIADDADVEITLIASDYTDYLIEGYYFDAADLSRLKSDYLDERRTALEALAKPLRRKGHRVNTKAVWGHPGFQAVVNEVKEQKIDLVVSHTRKHGAFSRLSLTNDDWHLVRSCPVPLLLVKEKEWTADTVMLAAVDPKHARHKPLGLDHKILNVALAVGKMIKNDAHVVHSYGQMPFAGVYPGDLEASHKAAFEELLADFDIPVDRQHLIEEAPEFGLKQIEKKLLPSIIVMGAISRNVLTEIFVGSTTEKVIDYMACDVLLVKPDA
jgi:universal stress protein E